jgi:hypothetical protein
MHDGSSDGLPKQFVGTWRLASWTLRLADGTTRADPKTVAYLIYSEEGRMCYVSMKPDRPKWKSETAPTAEEALSAITGLSAYSAAVEVHEEEGFVIHHVDVERVPNVVGRKRKRWFRFDGPDRLTLRVDAAELAPGVVESTLVWERVAR